MVLEYDKPPLVEALCEFRFRSDSWPWTVPSLFYQEVKKSGYTKQREARSVEFTIPGPQEPRSQVTKRQFVLEDDSAMLQVGPNLLVINFLIYPSWDEFSRVILENHKRYSRLAEPDSIERVILRYINRVEVPSDDFAFEKYFAFLPQLPEAVPKTISQYLIQSEVPYEDPPGMLRFVFGSEPTLSSSKVVSFLLDMSFGLAGGQLAGQDLAEWLKTTHQRLEDVFVSSMTPYAHDEVFGRRKR